MNTQQAATVSTSHKMVSSYLPEEVAKELKSISIKINGVDVYASSAITFDVSQHIKMKNPKEKINSKKQVKTNSKLVSLQP
jgi:hypothetical protein